MAACTPSHPKGTRYLNNSDLTSTMADADNDSNSTVELHRDGDLALELARLEDRNRGARGHSNTSLLSREVHDYDGVCIDSIQLPFLADSIRQDAVYHYGCIKELQSPKNLDTGSGSESSGCYPLSHTSR